MIDYFNRLPMKQKLIVVIMVTSCLVLLFSFAAYSVNQRLSLRTALIEEVQILAETMGSNCAAPIIFNDTGSAREVLHTLTLKPHILSCEILRRDGSVFASYRGSGAGAGNPLAPSPELVGQGYLFSREHLDLIRPIQFEGEALGQVLIRSSLAQMDESHMRHTLFGVAGLLVASLLALVLATRMQKVISAPIVTMAEAMRAVSLDQDYSRRVVQESGGCLSTLIDSFNHMLGEVEKRDQQLQENEARYNYLAHHDSLTALPNRLLFQDRLHQDLIKARRAKKKVALLFMDLDRFKNINDSLGHDVGDEVLKEVALRFKECVREEDSVARFGGDEFLVILEDCEHMRHISLVAQRLLNSLVHPVKVNGRELFITTSMGISLYPVDSQDVSGLLKCADVAMYRSKAKGGNIFQFYTPDMNARSKELLELEHDLRQALAEDQFILHYQPQLDLRTGKIIGVEALLRWQHPQKGMIPPGDFIPLAEETGLIVSIGEWVLHTACAQAKAWQEEGRSPIIMATNISTRQFRQTGLAALVAEALEATGLEPHHLELEITESMIMEDVDRAIFTMRELHRMGVHLSIDDFGTGYSSLSYLKRFPITNLKIDRSFVREVTSDANDAAIATSVIALAHSMNLQVIAEGVETQDQSEFLQGLCCDKVQGFLYGRPLPPDEVAVQFLSGA